MKYPISSTDCCYKRTESKTAYMAAGIIRKIGQTGHEKSAGKIGQLTGKLDMEFADAVLKAALRANIQYVRK